MFRRNAYPTGVRPSFVLSFASRALKGCGLIMMLCQLLLLLRFRGGASDDLSPDGEIARRIRAELAAHRPLPDSQFAVAQTSDGRGKGLFVSGEEPIEQGAYLFDYGGRLIDQEEYDDKYPNAHTGGPHADYAVGLVLDDGSSVYVDAAEPEESNLARYMNHAEPHAANVVAWTLTTPVPRVLLFVSEDVAPGEELVWSYGEGYWSGREGDRV